MRPARWPGQSALRPESDGQAAYFAPASPANVLLRNRPLPGGRLRRCLLRGGLVLFCLLSLSLLFGGCASDTERASDPSHDLYDPNPSRRMEAISTVRTAGDRTHVPRLVELLDDRDPAVRAFAIQTLEELTGRTSTYRAYASSPERRAAVLEWQGWLAAESQAESSAPSAAGQANSVVGGL